MAGDWEVLMHCVDQLGQNPDVGEDVQEEVQEEMAARREILGDRNNYDVGCPLCWAPVPEYDAADGGSD